MLTIRLSRTGKRHKPQYRIVVQEKQHDPWSPAIEVIGLYNPGTTPSSIQFDEERAKHWLEKGAIPSNTVHNMLVNAGLLKAEKAKSVQITKKRTDRMESKKVEAAEKKAKAEAKKAEAEAAAEEAAKAEKAAAEEAKKAEAEAKAAEATKPEETEAPAEIEPAVEETKVETVEENPAE
ncbi:MAG: 30S ribosomal protein S16 [Patescibacteria group bacterium]